MKSGKNVVVAVFSLLAGVLLGGYSAIYFTSIFFVDSAYMNEVAESTIKLDALLHLRNGDHQEAISTLEVGLNSNKLIFNSVDSLISDDTKSHIAKSLEKIDSYEQNYKSLVD